MQDTDGLSAAQLAANQGHVEVVGRILDASRNHMQKGFSALHLAVQNGLDRLVQQLLVLPSTSVDARDADGLTALHWAAAEGKDSITNPHAYSSVSEQKHYRSLRVSRVS